MQDQRNFVFASRINVNHSDWPPWAVSMDANRDGEISRIEFPGTVQQFQSLDGNDDGFVDTAEIAGTQ